MNEARVLEELLRLREENLNLRMELFDARPGPDSWGSHEKGAQMECKRIRTMLERLLKP
jgi:hypothetical protein